MRSGVSVSLALVVATVVLVGNRHVRAQQPPGELFDRLDHNGDGKLAREEFPEQFRARFDRMDGDKDGSVSRQEFAAARRGAPQERTGQQVGQPPRVPDGVKAEFDIPYAGTDNPRQRLDLYLPENPAVDGPLPVVVWIHGGAWLGGDKRSGLGQLARLVASGRYAGISVGYRLSKEATWPEQIYDCKAAIRWIRANASKWRLDPQRIAVWGSSAGGHLVAMLGTSGDVKELEGAVGNCDDQSSRVSCVVDYFGPTNLLTIGDHPSNLRHNAPDSPGSLLIGGPLQENRDAARSASPTTYVSSDDPPFLIVHGDQDMTVPYQQSVELHEALRKAGVDSTLILVRGAGHGFRNPQVLQRVEAFLERHLLGNDVQVSGEPIDESQG